MRRRTSNRYEVLHNGRKMTLCEFAAVTGYKTGVVYSRYHAGHTTAEALLHSLQTQPPGTRKQEPQQVQQLPADVLNQLNQWSPT